MAQHILDAYKDGFKWVPFCKECGDENPVGECTGKLLCERIERPNKVDTKLEHK